MVVYYNFAKKNASQSKAVQTSTAIYFHKPNNPLFSVEMPGFFCLIVCYMKVISFPKSRQTFCLMPLSIKQGRFREIITVNIREFLTFFVRFSVFGRLGI